MTRTCVRAARVYAVTLLVILAPTISPTPLESLGADTLWAFETGSYRVIAAALGTYGMARQGVLAEAWIGEIRNSVNSAYEGGMAR